MLRQTPLTNFVKVSRDHIDRKKIYEIFSEGTKTLLDTLPKLKEVIYKENNDNDVSITLGLFDLHFGQKVEYLDPKNNKTSTNYDLEIADELLNDVFAKAHDHFKTFSGRIGEINIALGGDLIEGDYNIYAGQIHHVVTPLSDQLNYTTLTLYKHIIALAHTYPDIPINIFAIGGNHGEIRGGMPRKYRDNYDLIIARYLEISLRQRQRETGDLQNVSITISEDSVSAFINTCVGKRIELIHQLPKNMMAPRAEGTVMAKNVSYGVDLIFTGHFHSPAYHELGNIKLVRSGTLVGPNQYSHELGIPQGSRQQTIIVSTKENAGEYIISINPVIKISKEV